MAHDVDDDDAPLLPRPLPPPTWRDLVDRVVPPARAARLRIGAAAFTVLAVAAGAWWALRPPPAPATELSLPYAPGAGPDGREAGSGDPRAGAGPPSSTTGTTAPVEVVVHAAGAVAAPGLHRLGTDARVADLLAAAGGPSPDADLDRVNLAAALADGQRVWFPRVGEEAPPVVAGTPASPPAAGGGSAAEGTPLDLNVATAEQLEALPGIGPAIAAAIVEHRERVGIFRAVDDLLDVPGIGPARLDDLRDHVTV